MSNADRQDDLLGNRAAVLIVRLVLDRLAQLQHGELLDAAVAGQGRFVTVNGLAVMVGRWLEAQQRTLAANGDASRGAPAAREGRVDRADRAGPFS